MATYSLSTDPSQQEYLILRPDMIKLGLPDSPGNMRCLPRASFLWPFVESILYGLSHGEKEFLSYLKGRIIPPDSGDWPASGIPRIDASISFRDRLRGQQSKEHSSVRVHPTGWLLILEDSYLRDTGLPGLLEDLGDFTKPIKPMATIVLRFPRHYSTLGPEELEYWRRIRPDLRKKPYKPLRFLPPALIQHPVPTSDELMDNPLYKTDDSGHLVRSPYTWKRLVYIRITDPMKSWSSQYVANVFMVLSALELRKIEDEPMIVEMALDEPMTEPSFTGAPMLLKKYATMRWPGGLHHCDKRRKRKKERFRSGGTRDGNGEYEGDKQNGRWQLFFYDKEDTFRRGFARCEVRLLWKTIREYFKRHPHLQEALNSPLSEDYACAWRDAYGVPGNRMSKTRALLARAHGLVFHRLKLEKFNRRKFFKENPFYEQKEIHHQWSLRRIRAFLKSKGFSHDEIRQYMEPLSWPSICIPNPRKQEVHIRRDGRPSLPNLDQPEYYSLSITPPCNSGQKAQEQPKHNTTLIRSHKHSGGLRPRGNSAQLPGENHLSRLRTERETISCRPRPRRG